MVAIAAATILAVSCAKEIEEDIQKEGIIAHASLQAVEATKASGQYSYNIVWDNGDKIAVLDKANNKASFKLTAGDGTTTGTFQQEGTDALTAPLTAYYPASVVAEDKSLEWPATQADVKSISNVPMTAESSTATGDVNFAFKHLGSVLQLVLTAKNGTIDVKQIDITADQGLSGAFTVEDGAAVISNTGTTISTGDISDKNIKLSATASYLNFAVPSGSFTNFKITITDTNDKEYSLSAASLTLNRAMVGKVTFALDAKDPAVFEVNVNGHTVRVKLADDITAHDVLTEVYVEGSSVIVNAWSKSGKHLKCLMPDGEFCTSQSKTGNLAYTFIISDITENTTATIGYANLARMILVSPENAGHVEIEGLQFVNYYFEGEIFKHKAIPNEGYIFGYWQDQYGNILCESEEYTFRPSSKVDVTAVFSNNYKVFVSPSCAGSISAFRKGAKITLTTTPCGNSEFIGWKDKDGNILSDDNTYTFTIEYDTIVVAEYSVDCGTDALDGVFTVAADNGYGKPKKVRFSKGNLWYGKTSEEATSATFNFEESQWDFKVTSEGNWVQEHISHFMWSKDASVTYQKTYSDPQASADDVFFTNSPNFAVNGVSAWHTLSQPEWAYLLGDSAERSGKYRTEVTVNGVIGLVIAPDKFSGTIRDSYDASEWATAEINDGLVFLPAAGCRDGYDGNTGIDNAGSYGYYWSASLSYRNLASDLNFYGGDVRPLDVDVRNMAFSVRLVTEVK